MTKLLIYHVEMSRCIPEPNRELDPNRDYCQGWQDYSGMGLAVIGAWASWRLPGFRFAAFSDDRLNNFQQWVDQAETIIGFNSWGLYDRLCQTHQIQINTTLDLFAAIVQTSGDTKPDIKQVVQRDYRFERFVQVNLKTLPRISREEAPALWQQGKIRAVQRGCLQKVKLIKQLHQRYRFGLVFNPANRRPANPLYTVYRPVPKLWIRSLAIACDGRHHPLNPSAWWFSPQNAQHFDFLTRKQTTASNPRQAQVPLWVTAQTRRQHQFHND